MIRRWLSASIYFLTSAIGLLAFLSPFLWPETIVASAAMGQAHSSDAPLMLSILTGLCFVALLLEVQGDSVSTKFIALLGVLVAINSVLRLVEAVLPIPGGFSPLFFLILMTGYAYGQRFGFLMGALTLAVSALITGGVGPWLPYQMLTAGWVGLTAPLCRPFIRRIHAEGRWPELALLAAMGAFWGFFYGAIMNLYFWPFVTGPTDQYWKAGITLWAPVKRSAVFSVATSLVVDLARAAGNVIMILAFGAPTLRALRRFHKRFVFTYCAASVQEGA